MKTDTAFYQYVTNVQRRPLFVRIPFVLLILLALSLPFELIAPLGMIGSLSITNVELALALMLAFTAVLFCRSLLKKAGFFTIHPFFQGAPWVWPGRYWLWLLPFMGGLLLSALLAPQLSANAFKASLRLSAGMLLALAVLQIVRRPQDSRLVTAALLSGGLVAAAIGWWEISQSELAWTGLFRTHITRVGSILRLTGTFDYANQAAMFMEATLPFLVAAAWSVNARPLPRRLKIPLLALLFVLTLFYLQAIILTLSRAGLFTIIVVSLLLALLLTVRRPVARRKMAGWWVGLALVTAVLVVANVLLSDQFRLRLQGGNVDDWYHAQIIAPPALEITAGDTIEAPLVVTNEGPFVWRSQGQNPILLGARLLNEAGTQAHSELRWPFPDSVRPQETVQMVASLSAPLTPGVYELRWDVVHENVTWFGTKSGLYASSQLTVLPGAGQIDLSPPELPVMTEQAAWNYGGPVPGRATLWLLALQMVKERPLLGIGLDNFRLIYGERLDQPNFDNTVHTNNFYLELLVSLGILGTFPFIIWLGSLLLDLLRNLRRPNVTMWQAALAAGLLTFFIHGIFDYFLLFYATGLLFWLLVGLWISEKQGYAHRI